MRYRIRQGHGQTWERWCTCIGGSGDTLTGPGIGGITHAQPHRHPGKSREKVARNLVRPVK